MLVLVIRKKKGEFTLFQKIKHIFVSFCVCTLTILSTTFPALATSTKDIYRLYNPKTSEHFLTSSEKEKENLYDNGWWYEGIGFKAPTTGDPVYRLVNSKTNAHFYTASKAELADLTKSGWKEEGVVFYSASKDKIPVYRLYNSKLPAAGAHQYLTSKVEVDSLVSQGWKLEGTAWYAQENGSLLAQAQKKESITNTLNNAPSSDSVGSGGSYPGTYIPDFNGTPETYVLNTNTGKFHYSWCDSVKQMKAKNASTRSGSRESIIAQGYVPCKKCKP